MATALTVRLNGSLKSFDDLGEYPTIATFVAALGLRADRVAFEQNGEIAPRASWNNTRVNEGDHIELVHFVGGGLPLIRLNRSS